MASIEQAVEIVTDPANSAEIGSLGGERRFGVNAKRVIRKLRDAGAGKAEARELALQALEKAGGGAEIRSPRGARPAGRGGAETEDWWIPASSVRFGGE